MRTAASGVIVPSVSISRMSFSRSTSWPTRVFSTVKLTLRTGVKIASTLMTPRGRTSPSGSASTRSDETYPTPVSTTRVASMAALSESSVASTSSGLTISTWPFGLMSPAVTGPAPFFERVSSMRSLAKLRRRIFLTLRRICTTSSRTPGSEENSCMTPSICTAVTAAPSSDPRRTRRSALPRVTP